MTKRSNLGISILWTGRANWKLRDNILMIGSIKNYICSVLTWKWWKFYAKLSCQEDIGHVHSIVRVMKATDVKHILMLLIAVLHKFLPMGLKDILRGRLPAVCHKLTGVVSVSPFFTKSAFKVVRCVNLRVGSEVFQCLLWVARVAIGVPHQTNTRRSYFLLAHSDGIVVPTRDRTLARKADRNHLGLLPFAKFENPNCKLC